MMEEHDEEEEDRINEESKMSIKQNKAHI